MAIATALESDRPGKPRPRTARYDRRADQSALRRDGRMAKMLQEEPPELLPRELTQVVGIGGPADRGIDVAVRSRDHQHAIRPHDAPDFYEKRLLLGKMFERLEGDDDIDRSGGEGDAPRIAGDIAQVRSRILRGGVGHRGGVDIDPNHPPRDLRQQGRSVSFAAGYIEDILATAPVSRKQIPVEVLDLDLSMRGGGPPFTGTAVAPALPDEIFHPCARLLAFYDDAAIKIGVPPPNFS